MTTCVHLLPPDVCTYCHKQNYLPMHETIFVKRPKFSAVHFWHALKKNLIFIHLGLAFGRSACGIFNDFADILEWILKFWALIQLLLHYLDDFFFS